MKGDILGFDMKHESLIWYKRLQSYRTNPLQNIHAHLLDNRTLFDISFYHDWNCPHVAEFPVMVKRSHNMCTVYCVKDYSTVNFVFYYFLLICPRNQPAKGGEQKRRR